METESLVVEAAGSRGIQGYIDIQVKRSEVIKDLREGFNNVPDVAMPRRYRYYLLPLVIVIEIIEMLVVSGAVALAIVTSRLMTVNYDMGKMVNTELSKCVLILAYLHFAQKWRKLVPVISFFFYAGIALVCFYNVYLFWSHLSCTSDKNA